jgi:hypothetical protein
MVNVTDGADVAVRLVTLEFFLGHGPVPNVQCEEIGSASGFDEGSIEPFGAFFKGGGPRIVAYFDRIRVGQPASALDERASRHDPVSWRPENEPLRK